MTGQVTRRDFLNGMALAIAAGVAPSHLFAARMGVAPYPPSLTGLRGSQPGSFEVAHALRDGRGYDIDRVAARENVDLVVVGAGISGLAAAWFWRQRRPNARILILDNHADFGGHAVRNEFNIGGRMLLGYGGSESLQSPATLWSEEAKGLLAALAVDIARFETAFDQKLYPSLGLSRGVFFTRDAFGVDRLVTGDPMRMVADDIPPDRMNARAVTDFIADFPLSADGKAKLVSIYTSTRDPLPGLSADDKRALLEKTSYRDWLIGHWSLPAPAADVFYGRTLDFFAVGTDGISASDAFDYGYPGFGGIGLERDDEAKKEMEDPYIHHFPDGNASIARLLVRKLVPGVAPGSTMDDIVTARFDYGRLDVEGAATRLRTDSTVVAVRNRDGGVDLGYVRDGKLERVRAAHCVLACYNMMIPYLTKELGKAQREALASNVKAPLVYVKVAVRNWRPWVERGVHEIANPMGFYSRLKLDYPVSLGDYRFPRSPDEPMVLHLVHVPTLRLTGVDLRTRLRAARAQLYAMPFDTFEASARDELTRMLGPGGFDAERDIAAITVNRWGHGYSYAGSTLDDAEGDDERIPAAARKRVGRIAIANGDAAWGPYAHAAIDEAHRAVGELSAALAKPVKAAR
ncbi:MAG: NAD(P)/FAD-dependent oxidoreductase [Burkholderiales bacterium]|nr:NAD(P)/FAD-dependent oxidoreductase [Burkholderiales bacterium]